MKKLFHWLIDHWYIPVVFLGTVLLYALSRGSRRLDKNPLEKTKRELDVIKAGAEARELKIQLGHERAVNSVKKKYQLQREALDADAKAKEAKLSEDPVALARFLERVSR